MKWQWKNGNDPDLKSRFSKSFSENTYCCRCLFWQQHPYCLRTFFFAKPARKEKVCHRISQSSWTTLRGSLCSNAINQTKRSRQGKGNYKQLSCNINFPRRGNTTAAVDVCLELDAEEHTALLLLLTNTVLTGWRHSRHSP